MRTYPDEWMGHTRLAGPTDAREIGFRLFRDLSTTDKMRLFFVAGVGWLLNPTPFKTSEWNDLFTRMEKEG